MENNNNSNNNTNNDIEKDFEDLMNELMTSLPDDHKVMIKKQVNELKTTLQQNLIDPINKLVNSKESK